MEDISCILLDLFVIFASAKIASEVFERLRQPARLSLERAKR